MTSLQQLQEEIKDLPRKTLNGCWYVELGSAESLIKEAFKLGQISGIELAGGRVGQDILNLKLILEKIRLREYDIEAEAMRDGKVYVATTQSLVTTGLKIIEETITNLNNLKQKIQHE